MRAAAFFLPFDRSERESQFRLIFRGTEVSERAGKTDKGINKNCAYAQKFFFGAHVCVQKVYYSLMTGIYETVIALTVRNFANFLACETPQRGLQGEKNWRSFKQPRMRKECATVQQGFLFFSPANNNDNTLEVPWG